ncbi:MAG: class I SAM-dependent RNA methyltransferase [Clostridium sp.]|jgi:tRNA/tmRNA/rRNA uracil-C5-methylase (TrmA/RlmC/RlmD family)|nr:class I SAM-dependent RNA methyltransferase [Clostridium sp.]
MKKGQVYEGLVERVDFPNKGIVRVGEETCIVKNSLPGQRISFRVTKTRKGKAEARFLEVLEKSPLETGFSCSCFGSCGGCLYLPFPYEEQLRIKERQVRALLDRLGQPYTWEGIQGSPKEYEYRNKMEFSFGDEQKGGALTLGMHKRGSFFDVADAQDCQLVDRDYRLIVKAVKEYFSLRNVTYFHKTSHVGYLRHLLVRKASRTGEILVALVTTSQPPWEAGREGEPETVSRAEESDGRETGRQESRREAEARLLEGFRERLLSLEETPCLEKEGESHQESGETLGGKLHQDFAGKLDGKLTGILHIVNDSPADVVKSDQTDVLYGKDYFYEELLGLRFRISAFSFFQTNSYAAEILYRTVRSYAGDMGGRDRTVFDLYSGAGTIAQLIAPVAGKVVGVEIVEEAVWAARRNAERNGLDNCRFLVGDVLEVLDEVEEKPDLLILDPPRDGIHPKVLPILLAYGVEKMIYISCKPTSLVRDLEVFLGGGYVMERAMAVDQFAQTHHVECVVLMSRVEK